MSKQPAIIVDINGTLGDCTQRAHFLDADPRDWDGFFENMMIDTPVDFVHRFCNAQPKEPFWCHVLLTTGAPEKYRPLMTRWLETNNVHYDKLFMRGNFEFIKGYVWKEKLYREEIEPNYDVVCVLEDKEECTQMYRKLGLHCWLVAECVYPRNSSKQVEPKLNSISQLSDEDYFAIDYGKSGYISSSFLKAVLSGRSGDGSYTNKAMLLGKLIHQGILEPDNNQGIEGTNSEQIETAKSVVAHFPNRYMKQLRDCECEIACFVQTKYGKAKAKFDAINPKAGQIYDLKTTKQFDDFMGRVGNTGYDIQASLYIDIAKSYWCKDFTFNWLVVETIEPYRTTMITVDQHLINSGENKIIQAIDMLKYRDRENYKPRRDRENYKPRQGYQERSERTRVRRGRAPRAR
jgi:hypothetical protein